MCLKFGGQFVTKLQGMQATDAAALGNFLVNRRNASAGMTASVVSTVALAIVPSVPGSAKLGLRDLPLSAWSPGLSPRKPGVPGAEKIGSSGGLLAPANLGEPS